MFNKMLMISEISTSFPEMIKCIDGMRVLGTKDCLLVQNFNPKEVDEGISTYLNLKPMFDDNLKKQVEILELQGFNVQTRRVSGNQKNAINHIAESEACDLIVISRAKRSLLGSVILDGVTNHVINDSTIPVLLIRDPEYQNDDPSVPQKCDLNNHVLYLTDFSENAEIAFQYVKNMVEKGVQKVTILHVQDKSKIEPYVSERLSEFNEKDTERMEKLKKELLDIRAIDVDIQIPYGSPTAEAMRVIKDEEISLVVLGSQGRGFIKEVFMGSVSHNIVRHAPTSVLLIPGKREQS